MQANMNNGADDNPSSHRHPRSSIAKHNATKIRNKRERINVNFIDSISKNCRIKK